VRGGNHVYLSALEELGSRFSSVSPHRLKE
jgi:hypothetical protein